jgi:DNA-binding transcriptional regulator YhcF (GntR family)
MVFKVNFKSGLPVYLQLVDQVKAAVASGALRAGEPLPTIRPLAEELKVNRNTIAKAYGEMESQGLIEAQAGRGCFVTGKHSPLKKEARHRLLVQEIDQAVIQAHHLQVPRDEFLRLVHERFDVLEEKQEAHERVTSAK